MNPLSLHRFSRIGCVWLALVMGGRMTLAAEPSAYFSFQGDINAAGGQYDFNFSLSRAVGSDEDVRFVTFASAGGTNAAGDTVTGGGIDSVLELTDSTLFLHGFNDDASGLDSLIGWTQPSGTALNPDPLPVEAYRLNMFEYNNDATGAWAVDLIAPADAITLTGVTPSGNATATSLKFGTDSPTGAAATFNQNATLNLTGALTVAQTGKAVFTSATGTTTVGGLTTVKSGGTVNITGGTFDADDILIDGGTIDFTSGTLNLADGKTITARNNAQFTHAPGTSFNHDTTLIVESGADVAYQSFFGVGHSTGQDGTITVTGTGSTFSVTSGFNSFWASDGGTATLNVLDNASANIALAGGVTLAQSSDSNSFGDINVESGGDLTFTRLSLATGSAASGEVTVTGAGSTFTQTGGSTLTVGGTGAGTATIDVTDSAIFTSGTGDITINPSGAVNVNTAGVFSANGNVTVNGGVINSQDNGFRLAAGQTLTASNNAQVTLNGGNSGNFHLFNGGREIVVESGADVSFSNPVSLGVFSSAGAITVDGSGSTLSLNTGSFSGVTDVGAFGATGVLTVRNNASATIQSGSLQVASTGGASASTTGTVNVESGGSFTVNNLRITIFDTSTGAGAVHVTGVGSTLTQTGASQLIVGNAVAGTAELNISNNGAFTTGTGDATINATGTVNVNTGGTFNAKGTTHVNAGGTINVNSGGTLNLDGTVLNLDASANFDATGGTVFINNGGSLNAASINAGIFGTLRVENSATANLPEIAAADILIQDSGILNSSASASSFFAVNDVQAFDSATFQGSFYLGISEAGTSSASMILGTGDVLTVKQSTAVGFNKAASLSVNDGTLNADGGLLIGFNPIAGTGGTASVTVNAGTLNATATVWAPFAVAIGSLPGASAPATGSSLTLNDGQLNASGLIYVAAGNSFTMAGGELDAGGILYNGTLSISDGSVTVSSLTRGLAPGVGVLNMGTASLTIGSTSNSGLLGSALVALDSGDQLTAAYIDVGVQADALFGVSNGAVATANGTSSVGDGETGGSTGTVQIIGTNSTWNVGGGGLDIKRGSVSLGSLTYLTTTGPSGEINIAANGVLRGNGVVTTQGGVFNEGTVIIDEVLDVSTIHLLAINGDYTQDPTGRIEIGMVSGDPRLELMYVTNGLMSLAGELAFDATDDYSGLAMYSSFSLLFGNGTTTRSGVFDAVSGADLGDGTGLGIIYGGSVVNALHALLGDLNFDGFVGIADLDIVLGHWNQDVDAGVWGMGDATGDGFVGIGDLDVVLGNWNTGTPPGDVAALVPEPGAVGVLGVLCGGWVGRRGYGSLIANR